MKIAYIAGKYRAPTEWDVVQNIRVAEAVALKYWGLGYAVICPHKNGALLSGALSDTELISGHIELMKRCDVVVMIPGWTDSKGAVEEHRIAQEKELEIIYEKKLAA